MNKAIIASVLYGIFSKRNSKNANGDSKYVLISGFLRSQTMKLIKQPKVGPSKYGGVDVLEEVS
jgi:hypothetical protein